MTAKKNMKRTIFVNRDGLNNPVLFDALVKEELKDIQIFYTDELKESVSHEFWSQHRPVMYIAFKRTNEVIKLAKRHDTVFLIYGEAEDVNHTWFFRLRKSKNFKETIEEIRFTLTDGDDINWEENCVDNYITIKEEIEFPENIDGEQLTIPKGLKQVQEGDKIKLDFKERYEKVQIVIFEGLYDKDKRFCRIKQYKPYTTIKEKENMSSIFPLKLLYEYFVEIVW